VTSILFVFSVIYFLFVMILCVLSLATTMWVMYICGDTYILHPMPAWVSTGCLRVRVAFKGEAGKFPPSLAFALVCNREFHCPGTPTCLRQFNVIPVPTAVSNESIREWRKWKWLFIAYCYETISFQYAIFTDRAGVHVQPIGYRLGPRYGPRPAANSYAPP